jgi:hypothetical protein
VTKSSIAKRIGMEALRYELALNYNSLNTMIEDNEIIKVNHEIRRIKIQDIVETFFICHLATTIT